MGKAVLGRGGVGDKGLGVKAAASEPWGIGGVGEWHWQHMRKHDNVGLTKQERGRTFHLKIQRNRHFWGLQAAKFRLRRHVTVVTVV